LYALAHPKHRYYVAAKLRTDPLTDELCELVSSLGSLGRVIDAGAGRGQFGMLLLALGAAVELRGFDLDEDKVSAARCAAEAWTKQDTTPVEQSCQDVLTADYEGADTILLLDVLHYLPRDEQLDLIQRAASALPSGGRLVIREATPGSGMGTRLAQWAEYLGRALGANRGRAMEFVPISELEQALMAGELTLDQHQPRGALQNVLLVGTKKSASA
jgi:SAM-dependent methyltransferase